MTLLLVLATACSPYSPDLGKEPFLCGSGTPACPEGYTCMTEGGAQVCEQNGPAGVDGGNFQCANDSAVEGPNGNNTIATAYQVESTTNFDFTGLAICPAGDVDFYAVNLGTTESLDVTVIYAAEGGELQASIQTPQGTVVQMLTPQSGEVRTLHAFAQNLNAGAWYIDVAGPTSGANLQNNYELKINAGGS
ncbi:MAG TPA: hypothetical protein VGF94_26140 [Kofleriaceae bacterium]